MPVIGRTKSYWYLASQDEMLASISALPMPKNSLTSWSRVLSRMRDRAWAKLAMWPGGNAVPGPSAQYSALALWRTLRLELTLSSESMSFGSQQVPFLSFGGPGSTNWGG